MSRFLDLTGQRFGKLVAVEMCGKNEKGRTMWLCKCDCGNERKVLTYNLREGKTKSCGCDLIMHMHGESETRLYGIWRGMKRRCNNPNSKDYALYGGNGITVCKEWEQFIPFRDWALENGYADNLSIDRISSKGNYEPSNCRWADNVTQSNNRCTNVFVEIDGEIHTLTEWARISGVNITTIKSRYRKGLRGKELIKNENRPF